MSSAQYSLAATLDRLVPVGCTPLVSTGATERLRAAFRVLPAAVVSSIYLECRLNGSSDQVDAIVRVNRNGGSAIAGLIPTTTLPPESFAIPEWRHVRSICEAWCSPDGCLRDVIDHIWLEFDLPSGVTMPVAPSLFIAFARPIADGSPHQQLRALAAVYSVLFGTLLSEPMAHHTASVLDAIPRGASMPYAGVMLARAERRLRLCIAGVGRHGALSLAARSGWTGDLDALRSALDQIDRAQRPSIACEPGVLHLEVDDEIRPTLGLEYTLARDAQLRGAIAERPMLRYLCDLGACTPANATALREWPRVWRERLPHELWSSVATRRVNHVKLAFSPSACPVAKGYLVAQADWRRLPLSAGSPLHRPSVPSSQTLDVSAVC